MAKLTICDGCKSQDGPFEKVGIFEPKPEFCPDCLPQAKAYMTDLDRAHVRAVEKFEEKLQRAKSRCGLERLPV